MTAVIPPRRPRGIIPRTPMQDQILHPRHPERICWGCDRHCPADDLACGNGAIRTAHLVELFGEDWLDWAERRSTAGRGRKDAVPGSAVQPAKTTNT